MIDFSFIIPLRNEEKFIKPCLDSLLKLDYPKSKYEIVIAEGKSTDKTRAIINDYSKNHKLIKIYNNTSGNTAIGRNVCVTKSQGKYLINYSGHVTVNPDFLKILKQEVTKIKGKVVGLGISNISKSQKNQSLFVKISNASFDSFMGGSGLFLQNTKFNEERLVEHMAFVVYKTDIFTELGIFDNEFWSGQDSEFNYRLKTKGYKLLYTPKLCIFHNKRQTPKKTFQQLYRYGIARLKIIRKYRKSMKLHYLIPSGFVLGWLGIIILTLLSYIPLFVPLILFALYCLICFITTKSKSLIVKLGSIPFYLMLNFSYGLGFIRGFFNDNLEW